MIVARRAFVARLLSGLGLAASYGLFAGFLAAYLFPPRARRAAGRLFVGRREDFAPGSAREIADVRGRPLLVMAADDGRLTAFNTICPHLGCRVHWEPAERVFVCPCHQGIFDAQGVATAGPPAAAGQSLETVPLEVDANAGTVFLREA
jgi:nitrite reductase/ring-hydroxylating ferredoxin subunit